MKRRLTVLAVTGVAACAAVVAPAFAATRTVAVKDDFFSPKSMTVAKGTTIRWVWQGEAPHNVTVVSGPVKFRSGNKTSGSYTRKLTRSGTYKLVCTIHSGMNETIKVR
jgi:plastocyanin